MAIITSVLLVGVILSIVFSLSAIFIPKLRSAADVKNSTAAAYAAESLLEWCLYQYRTGDIARPVMSNGSTYSIINPEDCLVSPVRATGTYRGVTRAFELTY